MDEVEFKLNGTQQAVSVLVLVWVMALLGGISFGVVYLMLEGAGDAVAIGGASVVAVLVAIPVVRIWQQHVSCSVRVGSEALVSRILGAERAIPYEALRDLWFEPCPDGGGPENSKLYLQLNDGEVVILQGLREPREVFELTRERALPALVRHWTNQLERGEALPLGRFVAWRRLWVGLVGLLLCLLWFAAVWFEVLPLDAALGGSVWALMGGVTFGGMAGVQLWKVVTHLAGDVQVRRQGMRRRSDGLELAWDEITAIEEGPSSITLVGDFEEIKVDRDSPGAGVLLGLARQWAPRAA